MATYHFQLLRGTTAKVNTYTGYEGELVFDRSKKSLFIHDGSTQGGIAVANVSDIPTNVSQLVNDADYASNSSIPTKVSQLVNDADYAKKSDITTITSGTDDLTAGESALATGALYFVYE